MKSSHILWICMILAGLLLAGCGPQPTIEVADTPQPSATMMPPTAAFTATLPPPTATVETSPTLEPTATPYPIATINAEIGVQNLNLRSGPSTIYAILGSYPEGTDVLVLSRVQGNEWVRVQMSDESTGWMAAELLDLGAAVQSLPLEEVTESIVVSGRVIDTQARPVSGVNVAVLQRLVDGSLRTDAVTGEDGYFYAYIPEQSAGIWEAQIVGVACESWIVDEDCNFAEHFLYNFRVIFEPPPLSPILFAYQVADTAITGAVSDADGEPVSMRVFAERSDGAYVYVQSDDNGQFSLPVSTGTWQVYAMQYNPNLEGEAVTVQITGETEPEPVSIQAPAEEE
jgi:SH3-like domain-containing protein